ncbi:MAG: shikimate dehydrogenase [Desulfomonilaceae bacterium]|nr:shikimate dehydrogenase [Desulfomonilaceae bacterium]
MVTGVTRLVGILGNPVSHSLSPAIHNAAFHAMGMDWTYVPLPVDAEKLGDGIKGIRAVGFQGANVTVPHKENAIPFLDEISPEARRIGAVNTISFRDGEIKGDNTDWLGILEDLNEKGFDTSGRMVMILGSGGSARATAYAVVSSGADLIVCSRNLRTVRALVDDLQGLFPDRVMEFTPLESAAQVEAPIDLVINTTPLGMSPETESSPWPAGDPLPRCELVYDLVYNPRITRLMKQAREQGLEATNGLGMLVHQAAASFRIWTGVEPPVAVMKSAAEEAYESMSTRTDQ